MRKKAFKGGSKRFVVVVSKKSKERLYKDF